MNISLSVPTKLGPPPHLHYILENAHLDVLLLESIPNVCDSLPLLLNLKVRNQKYILILIYSKQIFFDSKTKTSPNTPAYNKISL